MATFPFTLEKMVQTKSMKDIQVKEMCKECEIERTTFYYHFCDKYDVIAWIFEKMFKEESKMAKVINNEEMIFNMANRIYKKKDFFSCVLQDDSQNNLRQYMMDFYIRSEEETLKKYRNVENLDEDTKYTIRAYSYGCMGLTVEWLMNKINLTPEQFAYHQYRLMPQELKEAYQSETAI